MAKFTVRKGKWYRRQDLARICSISPRNDMVAAKLENAGFIDVEVNGSGGTEARHRLWPNR